MQNQGRRLRQEEETLLKWIQDPVFSLKRRLDCIAILTAPKFTRFGDFRTRQATQDSGKDLVG